MMTVYEIWGKVCSHQVTGLMYHFQFADMFYFLGFDNLGKAQECRYESESAALRENHRFVLKYHNKVAMHKHAEGVDLIPSTWAKHVKSDVDKSTRKNQLANVFDTWLAWETQTRDLYSEMYLEAKKQHAIVDACRLKEMLLDVEEELAHVRDSINKLKMHEYSTEAALSL